MPGLLSEVCGFRVHHAHFPGVRASYSKEVRLQFPNPSDQMSFDQRGRKINV